MKPYAYQLEVANILLNKKRNVILQAPTGAGKNLAALLPWLHAMEYDLDFPQKCIYSVPMRVLANQFVTKSKQAIMRAGRNDKISVAIQTGDRPEDKEFAANLIFATIDQTLSSFLLNPYSLSKRQGNLNAGAIVSSYLVFDEFHLFDPSSTLPTTLEMLKMLKGVTPFILMTATFSQTMLTELAPLLDAEIVPTPGDAKMQQQLQALPSQQKTRRYHLIENEPLSAQTVLNNHKRRTLVICNVVKRARDLFEQLRSGVGDNAQVLLLHSRFLQKDRKEIEDKIGKLFAKGNTEGDYIVVSTQAIEVGVDITSTALHTELAPANAILQRAGRCARYQGDEGDVYIYTKTKVDEEEINLLEKVMPYKNQREQFGLTRDTFAVFGDGAVLDFEKEQELVNRVHGKQDERIIQELRAGSYSHRQHIFSVMRGEDMPVGSLVREVFQQQVTVHPNPEAIRANPFDVPSFGFHPGTVQGMVKDWLERFNTDESMPWAVKYLHDYGDEADTNEERFEWFPVKNERVAWGAKLIVVHPRLATYDAERGFLEDRGGDWPSPADLQAAQKTEKERPQFTYKLETYEEHISQVYKAFLEFWPEAEFAARKLEKRYGWKTGSVGRAAELAVLLHDVGKLSVAWQGWVREYQKRIDMPVEPGTAYGHTELQTDWQRGIEKTMKRRPWHAVEGAWAVDPLLWKAFDNDPILVKATYSVIARHHTPHSYNNQKYKLTKDAQHHINNSLTKHGYTQLAIELNEVGRKDEDLRREYVIDLNDDPHDEEVDCFLVYLLIARVLRRADQLGTARGAKGI